MPDALGLDTYVIGRPDKFSLSVAYGCYDKDGAKLFDVKKKLLGDEYQMVDGSGKVVGRIHRKMISITPTYELYDGNNNMMGKVIEEINISLSITGSSKKFVLEDTSGNKIARLEIAAPLAVLVQVIEGERSIANSSYDIIGPDGSSSIAKIDRQAAPRQVGFMAEPNMANFVLQITDKSVPTLALVEFTIAVDHLYTSSYSSSGSTTHRSFGGPTGPGGFAGGGGGINIKL